MKHQHWWAVRVRIKGLEDDWSWSRNESGGPALFPTRDVARQAAWERSRYAEARVVKVCLLEPPRG